MLFKFVLFSSFMKAMVLEKPGPVESGPLHEVDLDMQKLGEWDALIKVEACGVCGTDLSIVEGRFKAPSLPLVPGHEAVGRVIEVGRAAEGLVKPGDLIGAYWVHSSCGNCEYCLTGREQLCMERRVNGLDHNGCYAEYMVVDSRYVAQVPRNIDPESIAPFMCAGLTAHRAVKLSGLEPGRRVAVIGVGGLGSFAVQLARLRGSRVTAISRSAMHLATARSLGADDAVTLNEASKLYGSFDSVLLFAPSSNLMETGLRLLKKGGVMVIAANLDDVPSMPYRFTLASERCVRSVSVGSRQELRELLGLVGAGVVKPIPIDVMPLSKANEALMKLKSGNVRGRIVLKP